MNNLSCTEQDGTCSWKSPYNPSNVDILQYNITVLQNDTVLQETDTTNTYWLYCPDHIDEVGIYYQVTVVPINTLNIIGQPDTATGLIEEGINDNYRPTPL